MKVLNFLVGSEKILFYLLIFSLPFQKRAIIYSWGNAFNEWNSSYLYLTDIIIGFIFVFWLIRGPKIIFDKTDFILLSFLAIVGFSLFSAKNISLGVYQWFKVLEFTCLFFYTKFNLAFLDFRKIAWAAVASGFFQAIIAFWQFFFQQSVGLHRLLEESIINSQALGMAKIDLLTSPTGGTGFEMIRAYGTLPHPNLLAVFLVFSVFCLIYLFKDKKKSFLLPFLFIFLSWFLIFALFLTFSRAVTILFVLTVLVGLIFSQTPSRQNLLWEQEKKIYFSLFAIILIISILLYPEISQRFNPTNLIDSEAVNLRLFYNGIAVSMIKENYFLGVGIGNFVWRLPDFIKTPLESWLLQPVHNVFLLIGAETGLFGLLIFILFLFAVFKGALSSLKDRKIRLFFVLNSLFLILLFFVDHYFWTLQQGSLLLWIGLGILITPSSSNGQDTSFRSLE